MRQALLPLLMLALLTACEMALDPSTGQSQTRLTIPGTAANDAAARERWAECVQFRSESFCERNLPGGRPPGTPMGQAGGGYPARNDP